MESSEKGVNIQFTEKALKFINSRRLSHPMVMVNMGYRSGGGDSSGCSGGGGGCGGESESPNYIPYANVVIVDGGEPGDDFVKVDSRAGVSVYVAQLVLKRARQSGNPLFIDLKGLVMKRLSLEGLDMTPQKGTSCH